MEMTIQTIVTLVGLGMTLLAFLGLIFNAIEKSQNKIAADLKAHDEENQKFISECNAATKESNRITQESNREMQQTMQELNVEVVKLTSAMANNLEADRGRDKRAEKRDEVLQSLVEITRDHSWRLNEHEKRLDYIENTKFIKEYKHE